MSRRDSWTLFGHLLEQGPYNLKAKGKDSFDRAAGGVSLPDVRGHAREAGLMPGDQLVSIAGRKIATQDDLTASVSANLSGDVVPVTYVRNGEGSTLHLPLHAGGTSSIAKYRSDDFPTALEYSPPVRFMPDGVRTGYRVSDGKRQLHVLHSDETANTPVLLLRPQSRS